MNRSNYPTAHPVRELCRDIALAVVIGLIAAMVLSEWWFA